MRLTDFRDNRQARIRRFVTWLAERGGWEQYWIHLHGESFNRAEKAAVLRYCIPSEREAVALDAGCGEGRLTFALARMYSHVYALDFSEKSCEHLRKTVQDRRVENITTHRQDILHPVNLPQVDTIVLVQVLQHFDNQSDRIRVLRNLRECLKVGGRILITVFNHDRILNRLRPIQRDVDKINGYPYFHYFQIKELEDLLCAAGFAEIRIRGCINIPAFIHESCHGSFAWKLDTRLSTFAPSRYLGIYLLATAEKLEI